ncbi:TIGR03086 family protein [Streptomonospora sp. PA3]|uniref:TIGR03086 family metal-binding protein n=1 Tax=Streptomonospora sp. PA3 TaxID=2607326 RepID=UPI0012DE9F4F|nr:TIGR03086 family metal-binding protein [Streptomonospora sp. PA3]MUL40676.1 TIGR03086 family protein [Streptomonospora sp. PA3]
MTDLLDLHGQAMAEFDRRVRAIRVTQWADPTPCTDWDVHDLLNHLTGEQLWAPFLLAGGRIEEAGDRYEGDVLGEEPVATWEVASREARSAWLQPGTLQRTVHLSFGDATGETYLWQMTFDLGVHAWDLARAIGADEKLDTGLVEALLDWLGGQGPGAGALFAPPVAVEEDADAQTRLLALTGRRA